MKRKFLCECNNSDCREEFTMRDDEYKRITISNGRIVVRAHRLAGEKIRAVADNIYVVEGGTEWPPVKK